MNGVWEKEPDAKIMLAYAKTGSFIRMIKCKSCGRVVWASTRTDICNKLQCYLDYYK